MALTDLAWYVNYGNGTNSGYYAVAQWAANTVYAAGALVRQLAAPAVGSERVFIAVAAGTSHATTEPTWTLTRGALNTDNTVTWQECTGIAALNGDATNTPTWTSIKNTAITLGQVIKRDNGASYQICTTAGTAGNGSEPSFSNTAGTGTADNTVTWTSLGVVGGFTGWQAPHARLASAFTATWGAAGNSFFIASEHAETQAAAMALASPGTAAAPCNVYCVDKLAVPPVHANLAAGATISTTGNNALTLAGGSTFTAANYWAGSANGLIFNSGSGANAPGMGLGTSSGGSHTTLKNCAMRMLGSSSQNFNIGATNTSAPQRLVLDGTTLEFGAAGSIIVFRGMVMDWINTPSAITGATVPTTLYSPSASLCGVARHRGVDLSALGSGKTLVGAHTANTIFSFESCKLGASVTVAATPPGPAASPVVIVDCDSGATNYRTERYAYQGTQTVETTIVRSGGASDGTTPQAWKIVTTANAKWPTPFESLPIAVWNERTAADITVSLYGIWGGGAVPNNDEIWFEVAYPGSSSSPLASFATAGKSSNLATAAALTADGSVWGGSTTPFKMSVTLSAPQPGQAGYLMLRVKAAKISTTFYIDPKPEVF